MRISDWSSDVRSSDLFQQQGDGGRGGDRAGVAAGADEVFEVAVEVAGVDARLDDDRVPHQPFEEGDVRFRPFDPALRQRLAQAGEGARADRKSTRLNSSH